MTFARFDIIRPGLALLTAGVMLAGCTTHMDPTNSGERKRFVYATRQLAPEPTYVRDRRVQLPEVLPANEEFDAPRILPVVQLELDKATLGEAARTLAATVRYDSYCASSISKKTISLTMLGTVDELAQKIAQEAGIDVAIDHDNRLIRFMAPHAAEPQLPDGAVPTDNAAAEGN